MLCNATVEPNRVNDGGEKEAKENGNNDDRQTDKRRLLEMPWPKGRHLKMLVSAPGQVAVILSMCTDWKFYIWIGQLKFDLQL